MNSEKGIFIYFEYYDAIALLSAEERGNLFIALLDYGKSGIIPQLDGAAMIAFTFIKNQIDLDKEKHEAKRLKSRVRAQTDAAKEA